MKQAMKQREKTRRLAVAAMLTAVAAVLQVLEFPIPLMPSFIKMDLSDLPALIAAYALGPWWGVLIQLVKNVLHMPFSGSMYVGELSNFLLGSVFVLIAGLVYHHKKSRGTALIGSLLGALAMAAASLPLNYYLVYPAYQVVMHFPLDSIIGMYSAILGNIAQIPTRDALFNCLLIFNAPFTLVKGLLNVLICFLIYKPLSRSVLSKELLMVEEGTLDDAAFRKKKRNLWILTAVGIALLLLQAFLWAVKLFPETFAFAEPFVKLGASFGKILTNPEKSALIKIGGVFAFNVSGLAGILCTVLGAVNLKRAKNRRAARLAKEGVSEQGISRE